MLINPLTLLSFQLFIHFYFIHQILYNTPLDHINTNAALALKSTVLTFSVWHDTHVKAILEKKIIIGMSGNPKSSVNLYPSYNTLKACVVFLTSLHHTILQK